MSQSLKMMSGDFPPSSRDTFFTLLTAQLHEEEVEEEEEKEEEEEEEGEQEVVEEEQEQEQKQEKEEQEETEDIITIRVAKFKEFSKLETFHGN